MDPAAFLKGRTRETNIRRDRYGKWFNGEDPIDHPNLVQAFNEWVDVADDGRYCLSNDINWAYVSIEGAPVFVRSVVIGSDAVMLTLSDGRREELEPDSMFVDERGALHCRVRQGRLVALFDRHAMQGLEDRIDSDEDGIYIEVAGKRVRPPVSHFPADEQALE